MNALEHNFQLQMKGIYEFVELRISWFLSYITVKDEKGNWMFIGALKYKYARCRNFSYGYVLTYLLWLSFCSCFWCCSFSSRSHHQMLWNTHDLGESHIKKLKPYQIVNFFLLPCTTYMHVCVSVCLFYTIMWFTLVLSIQSKTPPLQIIISEMTAPSLSMNCWNLVFWFLPWLSKC